MIYTEQSLKQELEQIYRTSQDGSTDGFMWEATKSGRVTIGDVVRYCWVAYDKARTASGPQVIGRIPDLHETLQRRVANILKGQTLFDEGTKGNVLRMNKWCLVLNDCWLLGSVHRQAPFQLMSMPKWQNVWAPDYQGFVVTARELIGLKLFGYAREVGPGARGQYAGYTCRNNGTALAACPEDYHLEVALRESRGPIGATDLIA